jgi:hypothetical protein
MPSRVQRSLSEVPTYANWDCDVERRLEAQILNRSRGTKYRVCSASCTIVSLIRERV